MSVLPIPDHVTPERLPSEADAYVIVHHAGVVFRVHYHAGRAFWVRREFEGGGCSLGLPAEIAVGEHARAIAKADAFLAQFRLPVVAS